MFWAYEAGGRFTYRHGGRDHHIPAAVGVHHEVLRQRLTDIFAFATWAQVDPAAPTWAVARLREGYCLSQGLPTDPNDVDYLFGLLATYGAELEVDLRAVGVDLVAEFQARHWRLLLNAVGRLPYATHWRQSMLNDPEVAERIVRAQEREREQTPTGIPVSEFTQTVALLRDAITTLRGVQATVAKAGGAKNASVEPYPGPITLLKSAEANVRQREHEALVARVLPRKKPSGAG